jgi:dTDP-4-amino-4,6-dideoxygalactose transaminase
LIWNLFQVLKSGVFTNYGSRVRILEAKLQSEFGYQNVVLMNNGTTPLLFMMSQLPPNSKVLTTPFSFVATSAAIKTMGQIPVFADVDIATGVVNMESVREALKEHKIQAMLFTHVYGNPGPVEELRSLASANRVPLFFDGAHALGVEFMNSPLLNFGDASSISFHATKLLSCGEGGALVTSSEDLANRARRWINFGIQDGAQVDLGINGKMSELQACLGLATFPFVRREMLRRKRLWSTYRLNLEKHYLEFMVSPNFSYFPVLFPDKESRDSFVDLLKPKGIFPRKYFSPSLDSLDFLEGLGASSVAGSKSLADRVVCLPSGRDVSKKTVSRIVEAAKKSAP